MCACISTHHAAARRRYYIGSCKLGELGWTEKTTWEEGLKKTIEWYLATNCSDYWKGDIEAALKPHPVVILSGPAAALNSPHLVA